MDGQVPESDSQDPDIVALVEQSLMAVRHDQSRRRMHGGPPSHGMPGRSPWQEGFGQGPHGRQGWAGRGGRHGFDAHDGEAEDTSRGRVPGESPAGADPGDGHPGSDYPGPDRPGPGYPTGFPGFGDSGRPAPGRRGRPDGSLGRAARFRMLDVLDAAERDGTTFSISTLAPAIGVDQPRASRLVQEAVDRGLVSRVTDPADARRTLIQLTAAGRKQISEVRNHRRSAVEQALGAFTPEEAKTFAELFARFVRAWPRD
ncbi:MarR family winged helix-turn-helix transcriptional regulator [Leifsonia lichenia]